MKLRFGYVLICLLTAGCAVTAVPEACPCSDSGISDVGFSDSGIRGGGFGDGGFGDSTISDAIVDAKIRQKLSRALAEFARNKATATLGDLKSQLGRETCSLELLPIAQAELTPKEIYDRFRAATVIVAKRYKCDHCPKWHLNAASGFFVTSNGVFVTSAHVVAGKKDDTLAIMTSDGNVYAIEKLLASSRKDDFAIIQSKLQQSTAVSIDKEADIGTDVTVISHPAMNFYSLSTGVVSRYLMSRDSKRGTARLMAITADFARGSSGGPVFNDKGAVVGMVRATRSIYYDAKKQLKLQLVFKHCVTGEAILSAIKP